MRKISFGTRFDNAVETKQLKCQERTAAPFPVTFKETWSDDWVNLQVFCLLNFGKYNNTDSTENNIFKFLRQNSRTEQIKPSICPFFVLFFADLLFLAHYNELLKYLKNGKCFI